jgi:hypothetical protein
MLLNNGIDAFEVPAKPVANLISNNEIRKPVSVDGRISTAQIPHRRQPDIFTAQLPHSLNLPHNSAQVFQLVITHRCENMLANKGC